jgi:hypothetical protein
VQLTFLPVLQACHRLAFLDLGLIDAAATTGASAAHARHRESMNRYSPQLQPTDAASLHGERPPGPGPAAGGAPGQLRRLRRTFFG